jgi:hypothetical protein
MSWHAGCAAPWSGCRSPCRRVWLGVHACIGKQRVRSAHLGVNVLLHVDVHGVLSVELLHERLCSRVVLRGRRRQQHFHVLQHDLRTHACVPYCSMICARMHASRSGRGAAQAAALMHVPRRRSQAAQEHSRAHAWARRASKYCGSSAGRCALTTSYAWMARLLSPASAAPEVTCGSISRKRRSMAAALSASPARSAASLARIRNMHAVHACAGRTERVRVRRHRIQRGAERCNVLLEQRNRLAEAAGGRERLCHLHEHSGGL